MSNNTDRKHTNDEANEIFARQREMLALTEEEKAYINKLGLDDVDLSNLDFFAEKTPMDIVDCMSLAECDNLNDDTSYSDIIADSDFTLSEIVVHCLDELYKHIEAKVIDEKMIDINEKLLCFANGADLVNAVTCMGLQLAEYNRTKDEDNYTSKPGNTGDMLSFYHNMAELVSNWKQLDADAQTTLAHEAHLVENDMYEVESMAYIFYGILKRVENADSYLPREGEYIYKPGLTEISADVVKIHYQNLFEGYESAYNKMASFISKLLDDDITLNEKGRYDRNKSVIAVAKMAAFGDADYELDGDEHRVYEYIEKPKAKPVEVKPEPVAQPENIPESKPENKPVKQNKKKTKAQKLAEKRAAKYEKADSETANGDKENSTGEESSATKAKTVKEKPAVAQEARDAMAEYLTFFKKVNDITDESNRKIMIVACKEQLEAKQDDTKETIDYAEKLLTLDSRNENFIAVYNDLDMRLIFKTANFQESFEGTLNEKLQYAKKEKAEIPNKPGIANSLLLPKVGLLLTVALFIGALMIPVTFIQSVIGGLVKIIVVLFGLALLFTTGPGVIFFLPIFIFMALTVFNIIGTFVNPFLLVKILLVGIIGAFAVFQARDISAEMRSLQWKYDRYVSIKKECLSIAENLLSICKERNMTSEMVTYYERLVEEFKKL